MSDFEKLYTVDDIAKMTSLTTRTIRNYLKDGSLQGKKLGGQWRFTQENIESMFDTSSFIKDSSDEKRQSILDFLDGVNIDIDGQVQICTIADIYCNTAEEGHALYEIVVEVINNLDQVSQNIKMFYEYNMLENKARFTLFGTPEYVIKTLELLPKK